MHFGNYPPCLGLWRTVLSVTRHEVVLTFVGGDRSYQQFCTPSLSSSRIAEAAPFCGSFSQFFETHAWIVWVFILQNNTTLTIRLQDMYLKRNHIDYSFFVVLFPITHKSAIRLWHVYWLTAVYMFYISEGSWQMYFLTAGVYNDKIIC
jgi:hypothetical protein